MVNWCQLVAMWGHSKLATSVTWSSPAWLTWDYQGPAGCCRQLPLSCSFPGRCESGSPCLWWLQGSAWICFESRAAPSVLFAQWRCGQGCWRGYSLTSRGAPASWGPWTFVYGDNWCTHCGPFSGPLSWRGPAGNRSTLTCMIWKSCLFC